MWALVSLVLLLGASCSEGVPRPVDGPAAPPDPRLPEAPLLASIFSDRMVLQRNSPHVAVWGWASPGAHVEVKLTGEELTVTRSVKSLARGERRCPAG